MISPDDAELAARDPKLPGLATLLDEEGFAAALRRRLPQVEIGGTRETYARYKPGKSSVVAYKLDVGGAGLDVYARAHRPESFARLGAISERAPVRGPLGPGGVLLDDVAVAVYAFPNDRRLRSLADFGDERNRSSLLREILTGHPGLWHSASRTLRYWPERRFVGELRRDQTERAVVKVYSQEAYGAASRNSESFVSRGPLRVARRLGRSDSRRLLVFEWLPGRVLDEAMGEPDFDSASIRAAGAALAELHAGDASGLRPTDAEAAAAFLMARANWINAVRSDLGGYARSLALRLAEQLRRVHRADTAIHGDFTPRQVLLEHDAVSIIDLDDAARGDPAADLGLFLSRLELRVLEGTLARERVEEFREVLLEGYRSNTNRQSVDELRITRHVAAELVRRAPGTFRRRTPGWLRRIQPILERAEQLLQDV